MTQVVAERLGRAREASERGESLAAILREVVAAYAGEAAGEDWESVSVVVRAAGHVLPAATLVVRPDPAP